MDGVARSEWARVEGRDTHTERVSPAWVSVTMTMKYSSCHGRAITARRCVNSQFAYITPITKLHSWPSTYPSGDDILAVLPTQRPQPVAVHAAEAFSAFEIINVITASCDGQQPSSIWLAMWPLSAFARPQMKNILNGPRHELKHSVGNVNGHTRDPTPSKAAVCKGMCSPVRVGK